MTERMRELKRRMRVLLLGIVATGIAIALPAEAQDQRPPNAPASAAPSQETIDKAIAAGTIYIRKTQGANGSWSVDAGDHVLVKFSEFAGNLSLGMTSLALLTLLHADVDPDDPAIEKGFKFLADNGGRFAHTYNCGVTLMAVAELAHRRMARSKGVGKDDLSRKDRAEAFRKLSSPLRTLTNNLTILLVRGQLDDGSWTYGAYGGGPTGTGGDGRPSPPKEFPGLEGDLSNTQYALLGLRGAAECGIQVPPDTWFKTLGCFLDRQEKSGPKVNPFPVPAATDKLWDSIKPRKEEKQGKTRERDETEFEARGWGYSPKVYRVEAYGSMTAVGVTSVIICKFYLGDRLRRDKDATERVDKAISDGCAWMAHYFNVSENARWSDPRGAYRTGPSHIDGYYLYSIERAGMLAALTRFGDHDWYAAGAKFLVDRQRQDGTWSCRMFYEEKPLISTCFAILFLKRATQPLIETHK